MLQAMRIAAGYVEEAQLSLVPQIIRRRRQRRQRSRPGPRLFGGIAFVAMLLGGLVVGVAGIAWFGVATYTDITRVIPENPQAMQFVGASDQPTELLDREGRHILYSVTNPGSETMNWVGLGELPPHVWQATVAIQDANFFNRPAFVVPDLVSALYDTFVFGKLNVNDPILLYLARHILVPLNEMPLDHPDRIHTDAILIMELRRRFTRDELLSWFLNGALYGNGAYGIETAARLYLNKSAAELTLTESALLAGIPGNPSVNPFDQPDGAFNRQEVVLDAMVAHELIVPDVADRARVRLNVARALAPSDVVAPHFALAARRQAEAVLNEAGYDGARLVAGGGLKITTALDLDLQYQTECALRTQVTRLGGVDPSFIYSTAIGETCQSASLLPALPFDQIGVPQNVNNGAAVVMRPDTGEILAYVGSVDYWDVPNGGPLDSVELSYEPGSMIRPYVYLTALAQGYTTSTMVLDVQQEFPQSTGIVYESVNQSGAYRGPISLREALVLDLTPPAVQVMNWVGVNDVIRTAHSMGLNSLQQDASGYEISLAAEGGDTTLADLTYSFGVLANNGQMVGMPVSVTQERPGYRTLDPVMILQIEDGDGNLLWQYTPRVRDTLAPELAYLLNNMMGDRELRAQLLGADNPLEIGRPSAVHAGLSSDRQDSWTVGYTPDFTVGVWMGNANRLPTQLQDAFSGPAPVWNAVMKYAHARDSLPVADWTRPAMIVEQPVCEISGLLPTEYCPAKIEVFAQGTQPVQVDNYYQMVEVNSSNGRRATAATPRNLVGQRVYFNYPEAAREWADSQGIRSAPVEYDTIAPPPFGPVAILEPEPLAYVSNVVEVRGNATLPGFEYFQLTYGAGLNPTNWTQIGERIYTPSRGGVLGVWDTSALDGLYSLRLTVVTGDQEVQESVIQVTLDNTPPEVQISIPEDGTEVIVTGTNPVMDVAVTYRDNVGVTEVIYYLDGEPLVSAIEPPFGASIVLQSLGQHSLWAEAFDAAGNSALSERIAFTVRRGSGQ
jgi:membrane peptidoglycan carboxypeptidase